MFTDLLITLSKETFEQIDNAAERFQAAPTDRQEFVGLAVEYAVAGMEEDSEMSTGWRTTDQPAAYNLFAARTFTQPVLSSSTL